MTPSAENDALLTQSERRTYQSLRARGYSHEDALSDALDGVGVDDARRIIPPGETDPGDEGSPRYWTRRDHALDQQETDR